MRILVVEDELKIAQYTAQVLSSLGYIPELASSGKRARELFATHEYGLVILDLMLPDDDGLSLCKDFKSQKSTTPILMLTTLSEIHDKVQGLNSGADDYMTKPFHVEELTARVRVLLRRHQGSSHYLRCGDLEMDLVKRQVSRSSQPIKLTTKEFSLLEYFLRNIGRPLTRVQIAQHVWDLHFDPESNVVDVYVKQLRKKIDSASDKKLIKTIVGMGYVFNHE
jgi:two-component system copper resistance phosphate regulon response regulator CusR